LIAVSIISVYNVGSGSWLILKIKEKIKNLSYFWSWCSSNKR